ncbi:Lcl C-terminal domain-containing protein [Desulfobulbus alkaliphilus]|uniref:Lcl C-terminal domain-containing protein n=1 Tax=Desulfobulbus alkaliphilus TaxID=869814 RepID=UPI0019653436|nr:DUF1566 domain-containing protein [Desulfobulbus alkaliphilus]MBM9536889.1 DUF1566 domain-containing protein [Desulfobulbus alkaliphilus]
MGLFRKLARTGIKNIDWDMTPEYTFGTFESWGGKERIRSKNERIYYFFIDAWDEEPKLLLMERGIKHARVVAEIRAPLTMLQQCVQEQGKVALFERTHGINDALKEWLIANVIDTEDDSRILPVETESNEDLVATGLPGRHDGVTVAQTVALPRGPEELNEEDVNTLIARYDFSEQERNPQGRFKSILVDNGDGLTVTDRVTGLMWQRGGLDIMSSRGIHREVERLNTQGFAGYTDWRLPSMAEALSLLEPEKTETGQYIHPCFSVEQPFIFVEATRKPGGHWFVDYKQGRAFWSSGTIPGGFGRLCRGEK